MKKDKAVLYSIEGKRYELELELVNKLKAKTINVTEIEDLIARLKVKRGHLKLVVKQTKH